MCIRDRFLEQRIALIFLVGEDAGKSRQKIMYNNLRKFTE